MGEIVKLPERLGRRHVEIEVKLRERERIQSNSPVDSFPAVPHRHAPQSARSEHPDPGTQRPLLGTVAYPGDVARQQTRAFSIEFPRPRRRHCPCSSLSRAPRSRDITTRAGKMSKTERIREEIGWLKVALVIHATIDVSLVAWLAQNYATAERVLWIPGLIAVLVLTITVVWVNMVVLRRLKELENL